MIDKSQSMLHNNMFDSQRNIVIGKLIKRIKLLLLTSRINFYF